MADPRAPLRERLLECANVLILHAVRGSASADNENYACGISIREAREAVEAMREAADALREGTEPAAMQSQNPPQRPAHQSKDWIERAAADIRDLNPDYHDFEAEVAKIIRSAAPLVTPEGAQGKFRKKPVVVDAFRLGHDSMPDWFCDARSAGDITTYNIDERYRGGPDYCLIRTLEGEMRGEFGDWIIRGVKGEIYPCKPDIFNATYEPALVGSPAAPEKEQP